jgi:hypothetical protein
VGLEDLNVGKTVQIYGFRFQIYRCDGFTREYLTRVGSSVPDDMRDPDGEGPPALTEAQRSLRAARARKKDARGKFLTHDKQVLRFYCVWDDRAKSGDRRTFCLQFFLIDDTVAITEIKGAQQGGLSSTLLHRCRLPFHDEDAGARGPTHGDFDYVTAHDLKIGGFVRVYKRDFFLYDCDSFTKSWYVSKHPTEFTEEDFTPIDVSEPEETLPKNKIPEHTGLAIGSEEDSLQNCISLVPKPPRKDIAKEFANSAYVLQFTAEMVPSRPDVEVSEYDVSRRFVVSFHVGDQTLSIFERASKDRTPGKFLERAKLKKDGGQFYDVPDMFVGATLRVHSRAFTLTACDKFTETYLSSAAMR